ncbi:MAG TPA: chloride channel protein [Gammaproteobacteria bacterium]|nr:chloride channel protein [Gammaproteobacteria bacterium]
MSQPRSPSHIALRVPARLGDFETRPRILWICLLAVPVGVAAAFVADALLRLIGLITNLIFYHRFITTLVAPGAGHDAWWVILAAPVMGGLIVGLMARYGSEAIRGHGMPEAIEAILRGGSRIKPRVAILKPISAAITIGTGGPFGAEGPIIMTGGAFGSLMAQTLKLTADERKTLLVAGAAAGMAATFNAPLASILLAVELLLFEFRPRSFVPVAIAVVAATAVRWPLLGNVALFQTHHVLPALSIVELILCVAAGVVGGALAWAATSLVYLSEDTFRKLPIHWMWWPAIGGVIIGIGGLFEPRALGVGYDVIGILLSGKATLSLIVGILIVKTLIWSLSLGSGTSGGVLAPVFMIGAALGSLLAYIFPPVAPGFWALMSLAAVVGGVMRSPVTGVIFAMELTHQWDATVPLVVASTVAYLLSVLVLRRSVLTEKVVRRGTHLTREYSVDPLEVYLVGEIMPREFVHIRSGASLRECADTISAAPSFSGVERLRRAQRLYPVLDEEGSLIGAVTQARVFNALQSSDEAAPATVDQVMIRDVIVGHPDMTLREAANLMASSGISSFPVVDRTQPEKLLSIVAMDQILEARLRDVDEERKAERILRLSDILNYWKDLLNRALRQRRRTDAG